MDLTPVRLKFYLVFSVSLLFLAHRHAQGAEEVREIAEKYQQAKQTILEVESQKRQVLGSLYQINQRMKRISQEKGKLTSQILQVKDDVKNVAKVIAGLEVRIEEQRIQLRKRLRALYKLSGEGYLAILFSRTSALDLDETLRFLKIVTEKDYQLIRNYQDNIASHKLERKKLREHVWRLVALEKKVKQQEGLLLSEHKAKSKLITDLDRSNKERLQRARKLRIKGEALSGVSTLDRRWDELLKPSIFEQKGQIHHPVDGVVIQDFGLITNEKYKIQLSHKGWRYAAPQGTPVASIFDGTVLFSSWMDGYGHTVVVDHGDHYYSVYAHISRPNVKLGDTLKKGQIIAEAGPSRLRYPEGMYFEIRHFSEPENPEHWIKTNSLKIVPNQQSDDDEGPAEIARATYKETH